MCFYQLPGLALGLFGRQALAEDAGLLSAEELARVEQAMTALRDCLMGTDADAIKRGAEALSAATAELAARRMDQAIRRALTGNLVDNLKV